MRIAVISDIHENFHNLILALQDMSRRDINQIICLGDLMNSGIAKLLGAQEIPVFMIWGNNDGEKVEVALASKKEGSSLTVSLNVYDFLEFDSRKIFVSHYDDLAGPMAKSGEYDAVFYGHNHLASVEKESDCWIVNPGEIAASKTKKASYAIYDTEKDDVELTYLENAISLKTPLMESYFKEHAHKMGLRSKKALELMDITNDIIPRSSPIYETLVSAAKKSKVVVFSGLPGVGKSLYINQFKQIAKKHGRVITIIQWDIARKAFETPVVFSRYPIGDGVIHNGVKIGVGQWLMDTLQNWLKNNDKASSMLLIEAPLVGHRFIELAKVQENIHLEKFLKSPDFQVIVPIPSKRVRAKIEEDRRVQIADNATTWVGAKPSVMLMLWKMICGIANEFGSSIPMEGQPPYDPAVYEFVFGKILKHRNFIPLHVDEIFSVSVVDEKELHNVGSLAADEATANHYSELTASNYPDDEAIDAVIKEWYLT